MNETYCPTCEGETEPVTNDDRFTHRCINCGEMIAHWADAQSWSDEVGGTTYRSCGDGGAMCPIGAAPHSKVQAAQDLKRAIERNREHLADRFPYVVINATTERYQTLQRLVRMNGEKSINRGNKRNQVLCAIFQKIVRAEGIDAKNSQIATLWGVTNGFSEGRKILATLEAQSAAENEPNGARYETFLTTYADALNLDRQYREFATEMLQADENEEFPGNQHASSKVAGVLWFINLHWALGHKLREFEAACDRIKQHTFEEYYRTLFAHWDVFGPIVEKWKIPLKIEHIPKPRSVRQSK